MGNVIVLAQEGEEALDECRQWFSERAYRVNETAHFVVCQKRSQVILLHQFSRADINADIICFIEDELTSLPIISSPREFGAALFAVLASTFPSPRDQKIIWRQFCLNTLARLREQLSHIPPTPPPAVSYIAPFAAMYQRVFELFAGQSLLDVGCSFGFLPVLLAEQTNDISITACDNNPDAVAFSADVAAAAGTSQVHITLQDVVAADFPRLGRFDTVTAIHLLEHLSEQEMSLALDHLLQVTDQRLIIAVPYEEAAKGLYGHRQVFTPERLHTLGSKCLEALGGIGRYWCEDVMGGMLVVERPSDGSEGSDALP